MHTHRPTAPSPDERSATNNTQQILYAARHDLERFADVYQQYSDRIYGYCLRRVGSVPEAEGMRSEEWRGKS